MSVKPQPKSPSTTSGPSPRSTPPQAPAASKKPIDEDRVRDLTASIAYDLFVKRGRVQGHDVEDWLAAEKLAREKLEREG